MLSLHELFRRNPQPEKAIPADANKQIDAAVGIIRTIPEAREIRGFGSAFDGKGKWDPNRRRKPSDIDLAVIFANSTNWSCFTNGERRKYYFDEEGDISSYPSETNQRLELREIVKNKAPLISLFMITEEDTIRILFGEADYTKKGYHLFEGITGPRRLIWNIKRGKLLWKSDI